VKKRDFLCTPVATRVALIGDIAWVEGARQRYFMQSVQQLHLHLARLNL